MLSKEELNRRAINLTKFIEEVGSKCTTDEIMDFLMNNYENVEPDFVRKDVITLRSSNSNGYSNGYIYADKNGNITGIDVNCSEDPSFHKIKQIDIEEWCFTYPDKDIRGEHDILDFGYWLTDGTYERPCYDWRESRKQMIKDEREFEIMLQGGVSSSDSRCLCCWGTFFS